MCILKNANLMIVGMVVACMLTVPSYAIDPKTSIGQWHLDEGSGNVAKDSSGNKRDGTLMNDPKWVDGKFGKALKFDGVDDCVQMPFEGVPEQYTLSVWIYQKSADIIEGYGRTILSSSTAACVFGFWLLAKGDMVALYSFTDCSAPTVVTEAGTLSLEKWYHIAVTVVKGKDTVIYVDGKEKAKGKNNGMDTPTTAYFMGDLRVGRKIGFDGIIDEVTIFNVVLPPADIAKLLSPTVVQSSGKLATTWSCIKKSHSQPY